MKKVAIVGASGYSGEELVRLLLSHPHAELTAVTSRQYAGQTVGRIFPKFANHPRAQSLRFTEPKAELLAKAAEIVFLALPHGVAAEFAVPLLQLGCHVIDLLIDRLAGLLSHQYPFAYAAFVESRDREANGYNRGFTERSQRGRAQSGAGLSFRGMQRKRPALRHTQTSSPFRN
jgi:hypothetical protein